MGRRQLLFCDAVCDALQRPRRPVSPRLVRGDGLRTTAGGRGAAGAYFDLDAGTRRVPVARLCGGALASTATIGAAKGRSVTPTVPCDARAEARRVHQRPLQVGNFRTLL